MSEPTAEHLKAAQEWCGKMRLSEKYNAPSLAALLASREQALWRENERLRAENAVMERLKQRLIATTTLIEVELPYIDGRMDTTRHQAFIAAADRNRSALTKKEEGS